MHSKPCEQYTFELFHEAQRGNLERVVYLIPLSHPATQKNRALRHALVGGHTECVKVLLPVSDLSDDIYYEELFETAIDLGLTQCVEAMLAIRITDYGRASLLLRAVRREKADIVRLLIPYALNKVASDERYTYMFLNESILKGNEDIFNQLLVFSNAPLAWTVLQQQGHSKKECFLVVEHLERIAQHHTIAKAIETNVPSSLSRKI